MTHCLFCFNSSHLAESPGPPSLCVELRLPWGPAYPPVAEGRFSNSSSPLVSLPSLIFFLCTFWGNHTKRCLSEEESWWSRMRWSSLLLPLIKGTKDFCVYSYTPFSEARFILLSQLSLEKLLLVIFGQGVWSWGVSKLPLFYIHNHPEKK